MKIANRPQDVISFKNLLAKRDLKKKNIDDICLNCGRQFLVDYLVRGVLIRSNMVTSGYVSSLPILSFTQLEKKNLNEIANLALGGNIDSRLAVEKVDEIIEQKGILSKETWNSIHNFCENLGRTV